MHGHQSRLGRAQGGASEEFPAQPAIPGGCWGQGQLPGLQPVAVGGANLLVLGEATVRETVFGEENHTRTQEKTVVKLSSSGDGRVQAG